jgi:hypothetical protein
MTVILTGLQSQVDCDYCGKVAIEAVVITKDGESCRLGCDCAANLLTTPEGLTMGRREWRKAAFAAECRAEAFKGLDWFRPTTVRVNEAALTA